jgi:hypothetical protein
LVYLSLGLGYILVYAAIGWLLRDQPLALSVFGDIDLLIPPLAVCAVILRRRRAWRGCHRLFWDTVAIGVGLWIVGHLGWTFEHLFLKRQSWLSGTRFSACAVASARSLRSSPGRIGVFAPTRWVLSASCSPATAS